MWKQKVVSAVSYLALGKGLLALSPSQWQAPWILHQKQPRRWETQPHLVAPGQWSWRGVAFAVSSPGLLPLLSHTDMFDPSLSALMKWFLKNWIHVIKISDLPNTNTWKWGINTWHHFLYIYIYLFIPAYIGCVCVCVIFFLIRLIRNTVASLHTSPVHQTE